MSRSMDLDSVAPDDQIETKPVEKIEVKKKENLQEEVLETEEKSWKNNSDISQSNDSLDKKIYSIVGHTTSPFSSLLIKPHVFDFEERDSDEKIILVARPHWFTNVSWIITALVLVLAPSLLKFVPIISDIPAKFQMMGIMFWYLITFAFSFEKFLSWYFDVYIITDERVIDIEFNNLLNKKFSEAKLSMIQDITSRVTGVAQTMFNYGSVYVQTAAEVPEICFEMVPNPEKIIKVLQILREEEEREALEGRVK